VGIDDEASVDRPGRGGIGDHRAGRRGAFQRDEGARPSPMKAEALLPRPPRQDEPWALPESGLSEAAIDAARVLFEQGLADPRGCAYREVELAAGPVTSSGE
jgi:hypothetical protein